MGNMYDVFQGRLRSIGDSQGHENTWTFKNTNGVLEEYMLKNIRDATMPKEAWDTITSIFSKKNDTILQFLENELLSLTQ